MRALLDLLRAHDLNLAELEKGEGAVLVCPTVQGRIFCRIENELMHRLDGGALAAPQAGTYFNIADNDHPGGPYSAGDLYSVFNGGALNFFELETIGAMRVVGQCVAASTLVSGTTILKGRMEELQRYLAERHGLQF